MFLRGYLNTIRTADRSFVHHSLVVSAYRSTFRNLARAVGAAHKLGFESRTLPHVLKAQADVTLAHVQGTGEVPLSVAQDAIRNAPRAHGVNLTRSQLWAELQARCSAHVLMGASHPAVLHTVSHTVSHTVLHTVSHTVSTAVPRELCEVRRKQMDDRLITLCDSAFDAAAVQEAVSEDVRTMDAWACPPFKFKSSRRANLGCGLVVLIGCSRLAWEVMP